MEVFAGQTVGAADVSDSYTVSQISTWYQIATLYISRDCDFTLDETLAPAVANYR